MIRLLAIGDYNKLHALWLKTDGMGLRSLDDSREGIERFIQRNPTTNFVYEKEGKILGGIMCGHDGRRAYIYHAVVDTEYRGHGIGKKLVDAVIKALINEDIRKVALVVFENNLIGNGFWKAIGFTERSDLVYRDLALIDQK